MKRHDTHLLSDESEKEKKEEDAHQYNFNNSSNSSDDSEEKYISKESNQNGPAHVNFLKLNNLTNDVNYYNNDKNEVSIISSKELEDIFYVDSKNNKNKNFSTKKKKKKKNKYFIKLRKIKLNDDELIDNCLTYNPSLRNEVIDKKIYYDNIKNKNRNCISLNNSNNKNNDRTKLKKNKRLDTFKEKEVLYFFYNDDNEGNKKLKNFINIINKQKSQNFQVSNNNNFSIKTKKKPTRRNYFPLIYKNKYNNNNNNKNKYNNLHNHYDREVIIRKNNNYTKVNDITYNKLKNLGNNNLVINKSKKLILKSSNNSSINTLKKQLGRTPNQSMSLKQNKNNEKVEILFNLYCGNHKNGKNKNKRVKSTETLMDSKQKGTIWVKMDSYKEYQKYIDLRNNEKDNRKMIEKLYKIQTGYNTNYSNYYNNYNKHFGNHDHCPLCQAVEQKNEESIKKMGIYHMNPHGNNDNSQNSWQNRRIYSALSRILTKRNRNNIDYDINISRSRSRSKNISRSKNKSINKNKSVIKNRSKNKENNSKLNNLSKKNVNQKNNNKEILKGDAGLVRKLNINRTYYQKIQYSMSNKFLNTKNKSMKFN